MINKNKLKLMDLNKAWYHGNKTNMVNDTVTAAIPGVHIYCTSKEIVAIVIRN